MAFSLARYTSLCIHSPTFSDASFANNTRGLRRGTCLELRAANGSTVVRSSHAGDLGQRCRRARYATCGDAEELRQVTLAQWVNGMESYKGGRQARQPREPMFVFFFFVVFAIDSQVLNMLGGFCCRLWVKVAVVWLAMANEGFFVSKLEVECGFEKGYSQ